MQKNPLFYRAKNLVPNRAVRELFHKTYFSR